MAGIFNKKQEVLDFILTREGRQLYHEGKFKPAYYEFYDSDIIYEANNGELQNAIRTRIINGLYSKAVTAIDQINAIGGQSGPVTNDNSNLLKNPMGTYQILNQNAPAWQVDFKETGYLTGSFSTSQRYIYKTDMDGKVVAGENGTLKGVNTFEERIPQFNVDVKYTLYLSKDKLADGKTRHRLYFDENNEDISISVDEKNAFELNESREFEIEVFEIVDKNVPSAGDDPYTLERRYFDLENFEDEEAVEKYFNILVDEETRFENNFKKKNIYKDILADPEEACEPEGTIGI